MALGDITQLNYIDLFCGIGGFHQAIDRISEQYNLQSNCLFAADIDEYASALYEHRYGINCHYDLKEPAFHLNLEEIIGDQKVHLICGGFPCQAFSKAGKQVGFVDEEKGNLFFQMYKVIKKYKPDYLLLENVRNLKSHDNGITWKVIKNLLEASGYFVDDVIIGPNSLENPIPAIRDRIFIMCYKKDSVILPNNLFEGKPQHKHQTSLLNRNGNLSQRYFNENIHGYEIDPIKTETINMWNDFRIRIINSGNKLVSPIWTEFFRDEIDYSIYPKWKQVLIRKNQNFYFKNRTIIDQWKIDYLNLWNIIPDSSKKFEWNAKDRINDIWEGIIQFRPSGVRVKDSSSLPTFVAINQTPILGMFHRYISPSEMARIYGFHRLRFNHQPLSQSYKQLGNTVSVDVVTFLLERMLGESRLIEKEGKICQEK